MIWCSCEMVCFFLRFCITVPVTLGILLWMMFFVFAEVDSNYNGAFKHLDNEWMTLEEVTRHTDDIRVVFPSITWSVECYHEGEYERIVTHRETKHLTFSQCIDASGLLPRWIDEERSNRVSVSMVLTVDMMTTMLWAVSVAYYNICSL